MTASIEKRVQLPSDQAQRLRELAEQYHLSEEQIIARALDALFSSAFPLDEFLQHSGDISRSRSSSVAEPVTEKTFKHYLSSIGLLAARPPLAVQAQNDRSPIPISGKPLSVTIVEERR